MLQNGIKFVDRSAKVAKMISGEVRTSKSCSSRKVQRNKDLLIVTRVRFDTAENKPSRVCYLDICSSADSGYDTHTEYTVVISRPV